MDGYSLVPVEHDPFQGNGYSLVPVDHDPFQGQDVDWSHLNQSFGTISAGPDPTPSQRVSEAASDALMAAGAKPYVANHLVDGLGNLLSMTPVAVPIFMANLVDANRRNDVGGEVQAMAGLIPGGAAEGKLTQRLIDSFELGKRVSTAMENWDRWSSPTMNFYEDWMRGHIPTLQPDEFDLVNRMGPINNAFFESGRQGYEMPTYTTGKRFGDVPPSGVSWNYREQNPELGVSMAQVDHPKFADYEWADMGGNRQRPVRSYKGWLLPMTGSDDEPLMVGLKPVAAAE